MQTPKQITLKINFPSLRPWLAAHNAASPAGESPAMVNDDEAM
jgi:hypothetical protein